MTLAAYTAADAEQAPQAAIHLAVGPDLEATVVYYDDSPSDEEVGVAAEA